MTPSAERVLAFWFGTDNPPGEEYRKRWFSGGAELDALITEEFGELHREIRSGLPTDWTTAEDKLAAIIVIDQFSRNIFRGEAKAFEWDTLAQTWGDEGWAAHEFDALTDTQRAFSLMPLMHSESLSLHDRVIALFEHEIERSNSADTMLTAFLSSANEHRAIIAQFGRYPHRNAVLGRENTPEESAYLNDGARRFGQ